MEPTKKVKLTKRVVDAATYTGDASKDQPCVIWCDALPGFGLRIRPSGRKTFVLSYRQRGRKHIMTLGRYGVLTVDQARVMAKKHLTSVLDGADPMADRLAGKRAASICDLCDAFTQRHLSRLKSRHDSSRRIEKIIKPAFGSRRCDSIIRADIARLHERIGADNGKYEANRVLSLISKMFEMAAVWGFVPENYPNPARRIERFKEEKRERWLKPEELRKMVEAINQEVNESAKFAIWLYLLTGMRKQELLQLRWDDIDRFRNEVRLPETKAGRIHYVPLSRTALTVLDEIPRIRGNPYVITGRNPSSHLVNINRPWGRVRQAAGIEDVRIHDLRRTVGSWLVQSGSSLPLIGRVLNHSNTSTTAIYARFADDDVRQALESHGENVLGVAGLKESAEVVPIKKR